jgi:hypothetical protein
MKIGIFNINGVRVTYQKSRKYCDYCDSPMQGRYKDQNLCYKHGGMGRCEEMIAVDNGPPVQCPLKRPSKNSDKHGITCCLHHLAASGEYPRLAFHDKSIANPWMIGKKGSPLHIAVFGSGREEFVSHYNKMRHQQKKKA